MDTRVNSVEGQPLGGFQKRLHISRFKKYQRCTFLHQNSEVLHPMESLTHPISPTSHSITSSTRAEVLNRIQHTPDVLHPTPFFKFQFSLGFVFFFLKSPHTNHVQQHLTHFQYRTASSKSHTTISNTTSIPQEPHRRSPASPGIFPTDQHVDAIVFHFHWMDVSILHDAPRTFFHPNVF